MKQRNSDSSSEATKRWFKKKLKRKTRKLFASLDALMISTVVRALTDKKLQQIQNVFLGRHTHLPAVWENYKSTIEFHWIVQNCQAHIQETNHVCWRPAHTEPIRALYAYGMAILCSTCAALKGKRHVNETQFWKWARVHAAEECSMGNKGCLSDW